MSASTGTLSTASMQLWQSVGFELIIFMVTLGVAMVIRSLSAQRTAKSKSVKEMASSATAKPPANRGAGRGAGSHLHSHAPGLHQEPAEVSVARPSVPNAGRFRVDEYIDRSQRPDRGPRQVAASHRSWPLASDPSQLVNQVCDTVAKGVGERTALDALSIYQEMKAGMHLLDFVDHARRSRHTATDFYKALTLCAIRVGKPQLIDELISDMVDGSVLRPRTFYESAMRLLAGKKHYRQALSVYDRMVVDGIEPSAVTCSCLINFAAEVGELDRAIGFFEKLEAICVPSIRAYMTILRVYSRRQDWPKSLAIYQDMQRRGVAMDSLALNVVLATGVASDQIEGIERLLDEAASFKPPISDVVSYNTLIKGYAQRSESMKAVHVIDKMCERGVKPNAITFNTAMDAAVRRQQSDEAFLVLQKMLDAKLKPDKFTCSILIKGLHEGSSFENVSCSLELLQYVSAPTDAALRGTLFAAVLEAAARLSDTDLLMKVFAQMVRQKVPPTGHTYRLLIQALGLEGDVDRCGQLWEKMLREGVRPQSSLFVALLETYLRHGSVKGALAAFESLQTTLSGTGGGSKIQNAENNALIEECRGSLIRILCRTRHEAEATIVYNQARDGTSLDSATLMALTRAQSDAGNLNQAWTTIDSMFSTGQRVNEATVHSFLGMCIKESRSDLGKVLFEKLSSDAGADSQLSQTTNALFIKLYGRCQQLKDAFDVLEDMTHRQGLEPSPVTYTCLLRACLQSRQVARALQLFDELKEKMKPMAPDGATYRMVIGGCASGGLLEKGLQLLEEAVASGTALPPDTAEQLVQAVVRNDSRKRSSSGILERIHDLTKESSLTGAFTVDADGSTLQ